VISRIGLVVHSGKPAAIAAADQVRQWAIDQRIPCVDIDVWNASENVPRRNSTREAVHAGSPDLIVTVGGDGTFLRGARVAAPIGATVLGVDVGRLGFLTEIESDDIARALNAVQSGAIHIDARLALTMRSSRPLEIPEGMEALLRYGRGPALPPPPLRDGDAPDVGWGVPLDVMALNDVVFEKLSRDRQVNVAVYVTGRLFASYSADALIVATPTGSTGYFLSAGGPIIHPAVDALGVAALLPHTLFARPLLVQTDATIEITCDGELARANLETDGIVAADLRAGDRVVVQRAAQPARFARVRKRAFFRRLEEKLQWGVPIKR